jgi:demethylmenaquinone methyltransferase/2-methoxy-6-polyprenyl-1,4-benzoquinol methylase
MVRAMIDPPVSDPSPGDETTHFGFRTVPAGAKAGLVRDVFDAVAPRYDLMNDLMSGGVHRLWKAAMVDALRPQPGQAIVDVAGGTGDIAGRILERLTAGGAAVSAPVVVCDINEEMLNVGRDRALDRGIVSGIAWTCGNAEALPFPDMSFDAYTIAFGLRNVTDPMRALREAYRVLRPGGRFLCLEFSRVSVPVLDRLYDAYSFQVLPWLGQTVAGDRDAYVYLAESIRRFPDQPRLVALMTEAGFARAKYRNFTGGIAALHSGWRI